MVDKSLGNIIDPYDIIAKYNLDYFRYYLAKEVTFGNDGNFSEETLIERVNSELVNKVGNLIYRTMNLIYKNCEKKIPVPNTYTNKDKVILTQAYNLVGRVRSLMNEQSLKGALEEIINLATIANIFIDEEAPWKLKTSDIARMQTVLYVLVEVIRIIGILLQPFIPDSAALILDYLNIKQRSFDALKEYNAITPDTVIEKPKIIFNKIEIT